jgi:tetratricopeptide (TPR) repeat protein
MLTSARQLAQTNDHQATETAFDQLLTLPLEREVPLDQRADIYVEAARAAIAVNDLDKAVARFLKASNLKAADPEQAEELVGALIAAKRTTLALQILRQLDRSDRVLRRIVDVYEMARQPEKAVSEMEELHRRHPDDAQVTRRLAELAVVRRDFAAGLDYYRSLWKMEPGDEKVRKKVAETMLLLARKDVASKRYGQARTLFDDSFRIEPPDAKLKREYGGLLASEGRYDEAIKVLEPLKDLNSQLELAAVLEMQGNRSRALGILLDLERTQPLGDKAERSVVRLLLADRRYEDAADRLVELMRKTPNDRQLDREFLDAVAASDHWTDPVRQTMGDVYRHYQESGFEPLDAEGFMRFGDALRRLGLYEQAHAVLTQAVAKFPQSRRLRFYLAQTLGNLGRYEDAEVQYKRLLATRPADH